MRASPSDGRRKCAPVRQMADENARQSVRWPTVPTARAWKIGKRPTENRIRPVKCVLAEKSCTPVRPMADGSDRTVDQIFFSRSFQFWPLWKPSNHDFGRFECGNSTNDRPFFKSERSLSFSPPREPCPPVNGRWCTTDPTIATLPIPLYDIPRPAH
ncbi:unnamed protein product [Microthlaspi erraticum]|uniref:Uncharacterized protein n=1 Tax=Microthlaspi erraticum TaxID=1685480 RepID=A0A6D2IFC8_9BRAS|nr:unnamed protein product [Microthlaspi erraticum]